jgi:DNA polymerase-3 subunit epsilon/exodeoxyribonuclease X
MSKFVILDTETTGTDVEDRIIQIGFIVTDGRNTSVFNELCMPPVPIKIGAMATHHITPEMVNNKPSIKETVAFKTLSELNSYDNYLLIHNSPFDLKMLEKEGFVSQMQVIDTLRCAKHLFPEEESHGLQYFRYKLGIYRQEAEEAKKFGIEVRAHDAIGDVLVLKIFIRFLLEQLPEELDFHDKMKKLVKLSMEPVFIKKPLKFGKHKGMSLEEIKKHDIGYLRWMIDNMQDLDEDIKYTINKLLGE